MSLLNKEINGYIINKILGKGSFGDVYIGEKQNVKYVLKFININQGINKNNILSIITEIYALKKITDNNSKCNISTNNSSLCFMETFINFDNYNQGENPSFCIVTNFLENSTELSNIINNRKNYRLNVDDILFIMSKLISQLSELHKYNIVHSDIKPQNIIVQTSLIENNLKKIDNVLFIDYGVSCLENCLPNGTISYTAPELLPILGITDKKRLVNLMEDLKTGNISKNNNSFKKFNDKHNIPFSKDDYKKTDVYSLGVTFYQLLNNRYPYPYINDYIIKEQTIDNLNNSDSSNSSNNSHSSNSSNNSDSSNSSVKIKYYNHPDDVIRNFDNQLPLLNYYNKTDSLISSDYKSENKDINKILNKIVDDMLILNPSKRPDIFEIKNRFDSLKI